MTVLVTGGTGVVGRPVVRYLVEAGRQVRGLARSEASAAVLADMGVVPVRGDICERDSLEEAVAGCDVVYHIAGLVRFCPQFPDRLYQVNVEGTRNVVRAARRAGVRRMVHTSSVVALGEKPGTVGSEATTHRGHYMSHYARSKHQSEELAFAESGDMEVVVVNPSSVQGEARATGSGGLLLQAVNGRFKYLVDTPISIVDTDDCARGHLAAEERGIAGERYVLSGFTISLREAVALMGDLTGRRYRIRFIPRILLAPAGLVADSIGQYVDSVPLCRETVHLMRYGASYDGSRARWELGVDYRSPRETFTRALESFRTAGLTDA
ncbi:MAG: SDR family NAD(P)-dependent oxidoreductase [bacterium]|nr:SDR family NAD(P)-dependent oxidoreductase [bacterium]MDE0290855.1 SDR family NAD(P)-dependent oxidoreductase [bacterium]MDE0439229.1 SDR family NAD(P)-dependent oxidoreductase [bacterium]